MRGIYILKRSSLVFIHWVIIVFCLYMCIYEYLLCGDTTKTYKTTPMILTDFTIPDKHHTTQKQYQIRKRIKRDIFSTLYTILLRVLSSSLCLFHIFAPFPPRHHIIVNVFEEPGYAEPHFFSVFYSISFPSGHWNYFPCHRIKNLLWNLIHLTLNPPLPPATPLSSLPFYHIPHLLIYKKTLRKWFNLKKFLE